MAHSYEARIRWQRAPAEAFTDLKYSRAHTWIFDGGVEVPASSAPSSVPLPYSKAENVDPEEAFVAAISSCHMLVFLYLAAKQGLIVDSYSDNASAVMQRNAKGKLAVTEVVLNPALVISGTQHPTDEDIRDLHHRAHEECYIANSVTARITVTGSWRHAG
ncbi:MAG TPA: OsmC family protein [Steroidobacteraceae bacterium]|nr:OsmC family protein [Steroidobacteraceae bacterium]